MEKTIAHLEADLRRDRASLLAQRDDADRAEASMRAVKDELERERRERSMFETRASIAAQQISVQQRRIIELEHELGLEFASVRSLNESVQELVGERERARDYERLVEDGVCTWVDEKVKNADLQQRVSLLQKELKATR